VARDGDSPDPGEEVEAGPVNGHADDPDDFADLDELALTASEDTGEHEALTADPDDGPSSALPGKVEAWRKRSATGAVLTGIAFGLQQVFGKEREDPAIIQTTTGDPPRDLPVQAEVEHGRPRRSVVSIRPWLLENRTGGPRPEGSPDESPAPGTKPEGD
jgi:hypothetical protein